MKWTARDQEARQEVMFDLMLGVPVEPLKRVGPADSEVDGPGRSVGHAPAGGTTQEDSNGDQ